ncbi:hypothetical protein, partial [Mycobacterium sp. 1081908.1]|uniref:hypothetical protein n=1 Tax=Mycobacterium sp. 1081908.1 TaxID=1834066 RepID=UPI000B28BDFC
MHATGTLKWVVASAVLAGGFAAVGAGPAAATARADDHCSSRTGCYHGPGMRVVPAQKARWAASARLDATDESRPP